MQDTNRYISGLLFLHDCVILPGFGGFVSNYMSAGHNEDNHTFTPPKKDVLFNRHLTYNDGLLINYLAKNQNITYKEAEAVVREEVQKAWLMLDKGGEVCFEGVGTFYYDKEKQLCFTPSDTENYLTDSYGMGSFRFPPLSYQKQTIDFVPKYNQTHAMNNGLKQTLKLAAIVIPIAGLIALLPYYNKMNKQKANIIPIMRNMVDNETTSIEDTHSAVFTNFNDTNNSIDIAVDKRTALFYTPQNNNIEKKQETGAKTFYIIGASYKDINNAQENCNTYINSGFESAEVIEANNLYRVSIAQYNDKLTALHELRRMRGSEDYKNAWLFSR